jgi:hypothetical protein
MLKTLRTLLIALAAVSPLLAGLQMAACDVADAVAIRSAVPSPFDGHREDDAGTRAEQSEEDDTEEEVAHDLQFVALAMAAHQPRAPQRSTTSDATSLARSSGRRSPHSRGPPTLG